MCGWRREGYTSIKTANDAFTLGAIQPKNKIHNEDVKNNAVSLKKSHENCQLIVQNGIKNIFTRIPVMMGMFITVTTLMSQ